MWKSITYGDVEFKDIPEKILEYSKKMSTYDVPLQIVFGTDSQTNECTHVVSVIVVRCPGHGGVFFYKDSYEQKMTNVARKLYHETDLSLSVATELTKLLDDPRYESFMNDVTLSIHVDASNNPYGKTQSLIPELVGWIVACGYEYCIKPDSFAASSVADRLTK